MRANARGPPEIGWAFFCHPRVRATAMRAFGDLYAALDETTKTSAKVACDSWAQNADS